MKFDIKLLPKANKDLEEIIRYISEQLCNYSAADALLTKFESAFLQIGEFPESCPKGRTEKGYRKLIVDSYLVFYKVNEERHMVVIYRIFYGMMDYNKYL